jgi:1-acyl-sn-glycerol-3-phosphate acyltransferase
MSNSGAAKAGLLQASRRVFRGLLDLDVRGGDRVPAAGKLLFVSNHAQRFLDPVILSLAAPRDLVIVGDAYFRTRPIAGILAYVSGTIFVAPSLVLRPQFIVQCDNVLAQGTALAIFPEGRKLGGGWGVFQQGAAYLALRNRCPILPVWVERRGIRKFLVVFGPRFVPEERPVNRRSLQDLTQTIQREVLSLRPDAPMRGRAHGAAVPSAVEPAG